MIRQKMTVRLAILFLVLGTTMAWSKRTHRPTSTELEHGSQIATAESKVNARYSDDKKAAESAYSFDLDHPHPHPKGHGHSEEYVDSEDHKTVKEQDEAQGNEDLDDTVKSDEYDEHSEKGGHKEFKAGGSSFDKHLKDHKADNKELENVKQHDIGEKFGGEVTKEHKLGKNKEKSKGHKLHGFKNVYHKEEYGDHKTFHDEFLDTDHQHNYDDHHEHQEVEGGKFSKGFKHEGKNNKFDKGDEKHEWGKEEYDVHGEGKHDKGGNKSKHRHATKKHQGHYDANAQRQKNAVHKIKKGIPPVYPSHGGHHGPHQAQIEPYVSHHNSHHESHSYKPHDQPQSHHVNYDDNSHSGGHGNHYHNNDDHHSTHGNHHHTHSSHNDNDQSDEYNSKSGGHENDFHERTAQNPRHRSSGKEQLEDTSDEKLVSRHEPITHKHESIVRSHEPIVHKKQPVHESISQKYEPHTNKHHHNHQPHAHNHHSHSHKQSYSPNHGIQQYRKAVYQDNSHFRPSQSLPFRQEKLSERFNDRSHNHNHRIRYGFQPRIHQQHHSQHYHQNPSVHTHQQQQQQQPFPRFPGFKHHHQTHGHHHHHNAQKNHSHYRHMPSSYQQASKLESHTPTSEQTYTKLYRNDDHHSNSQKQYE